MADKTKHRLVVDSPEVYATAKYRPIRANNSKDFCQLIGFKSTTLLEDRMTTKNRAEYKFGIWVRKKSDGPRRVAQKIRCSNNYFSSVSSTFDWEADKVRHALVVVNPEVYASDKYRPIRANNSRDFCQLLGFNTTTLLEDRMTTKNRAEYIFGSWVRKKQMD